MKGDTASSDQNILIIRADRIGDVVLSTPVIEMVKKNLSKAQVTFMVRPEVSPVLYGVCGLYLYEPQGRHSGVVGFFQLVSELREKRFTHALFLQMQPKLAFAVFFAGIPRRIGPLSKWFSFFTLNQGIRQQRSQVEMHEAEYNLELLSAFGVSRASCEASTKVGISDSARSQAAKVLYALGFTPGQKFWLIHPGMGGSALNWPRENYVELAEKLTEKGKSVLVSIGPQDHGFFQEYAQRLESKNIPIFVNHYDIAVLAAVMEEAEGVVAPSTGPLHIAVALGKKVVSFYPTIRVQSAKRWGPFRPKNEAIIFTPEPNRDMLSLDVNSVIEKVL